ncbi:hypothetical protein EJB05_32867 [Eragrostis curvula]|uniref:F-box protein AT5G49610-like beta-propeller domain-containing protein n=1 Tax=Eragrostis curvula TaxID=38414 RepID=A0A5J9UB11_9POAL|nr:hypothetical protein EJB05_32867 [Eragrostis curvula]
MATASPSRRGLQTAMSSDAGASSAVPPTPSPPTPKRRPPAHSTSPTVGVKHQDGEKLSSMEKRKFPTVKWAKAPDAKRFRSSMTPIPVKSPGVSSALDAYNTPATSRASILCCQKGHLLVRLDGPDGRRYAVLNPLRPARDSVILPPLPSVICSENVTWLNNTDFPDGGVIVRAAGKHAGKRLMYELRDGAWHNVNSVPEDELPGMPKPFCFLPIKDNKILISSMIDIAKGRWASSETPHLLSVALPDGVEYMLQQKSNFATWADSSVVYLFYVDIKALQLRVWLYRMDSQNWSREDTICMRTVFTDSGVTSLVSQDGIKVVILSVGPRRNAMCVLLQVGTDVLYIDIKSRTVKKVYTVTPEDGVSFRLVTFSMIFPPIFPVIKDDNDQNTMRSSEVCI